MDASSLLTGQRLLPVVVIDELAQAVPLANALLEAGIGAIEITLRTESALAAIELVAREVPEILVGAGSLRWPEQFEQLKSRGTAFAVSPGATEALLVAANMPWVPGTATASECLHLLQAGYRLQKFFPAEAIGGVAALKSLAGPIPELRFCPTGGVNPGNAADYLALDCVACVGGSWFVPQELLRQGDFAQIYRLARQARELTDG